MQTLSKRLSEYVAGCFTGIWIESREPQEALVEIAGLCREEQWQLATWNLDDGLQVSGQSVADVSDPLAAIKAAGSLGDGGTSLLVLENFHRLLGSAEVVQTLANQVHAGKQTRSIIVVLAPLVDLPAELEKLFVVLEHALPDRDQLAEIARSIATEATSYRRAWNCNGCLMRRVG